MKTFEFTLSFMKPYVWVYKVVIQARTVSDAYYQALYNFAQHIRTWKEEPERVEIYYIERKDLNV